MWPTDFIVGLVNSVNLRLGLLNEVNVSLSLLSVLKTPSLVLSGNFYRAPSSLEKFIKAKQLESTVQQADIVCILTSNYIYDDTIRKRLDYYVHNKGGVCGNETKFILVRLYEGAWDIIARLAEPVVLVLGCQLTGSVPASECSPKLIREPPYRFQDCVGKNINKTLTSKTNCPKQTSITIPRYNRTILPWHGMDNTTRCANRRSVKFDCSTQKQLDDCFYACCKTRDEQDNYGYRVILDGGSCGNNKTCIKGKCQES